MSIRKRLKTNYLDINYSATQVDKDIDKLAITYFIYGVAVMLSIYAIRYYGVTNIVNSIIGLVRGL